MLLNILIFFTSFCAGVISMLMVDTLENFFEKCQQQDNKRNPTAKNGKLNFCECEREEQNDKSGNTDDSNKRTIFIICIFGE